MHDIFLSYSTKDRERLQPLFNALENRGWSVFWDHRTIEIGDHWSKKINHAIRTSKCVLVVWSANSIESEWVLEEANIGKQRDVFLPIRIDDVIFPVGFTMRQAGDFVDWSGDVQHPEFVRLVEKIAEFLARHDAESQRKADAIAAEQQRLAKEQTLAEQQAREAAERQRRLDEEAQRQREAATAAEKVSLAQEKAAVEGKRRLDEEAQRQREVAAAEQQRLAKEQALVEQQAREAAERQRSMGEEAQHQREAATATEKVRLAQEKAVADQKVREARALEQAERKKREQAAAEDAARLAAEAKAKQPQSLVDGSALEELTSPFWKKRPFQLGAAALSVAAAVIYIQQLAAVTLPEMIDIIPEGSKPVSFTMGCKEERDDVEGGCTDGEKPAHTVTLTKPYKLAKTEVTVAQYMACVKASGCEKPAWGTAIAEALKGENSPIVGVGWNDATAYVKWLSKETGKSYRLPTEAEWEYAARGGTDTAYPWGNKASHELANYGEDECCDGLASGKDKWFYTSPVGSFAANPYGLHDMQGNVYEWVSDWRGDYMAKPQQDPQGATSGANRVVRGGSWSTSSMFMRSASRHDLASDYSGDEITGFRPAQGQ